MSCLTVYADDTPGTPLSRSEDPAAIAAALAGIGVTFTRWESPVSLRHDADAETILAAYRPYLDQLMGTSGAGSADIVQLTPDHPQADTLREKFLAEHTHTEDEIRFFVAGSGNFILHIDGRIYDAHCCAGDLIHVPADIRHWFDAGARPDFTALRVFTETSGWVPHFTGANHSTRFPAAR